MEHEPRPARQPVVLEQLARAFVDEQRRTVAGDGDVRARTTTSSTARNPAVTALGAVSGADAEPDPDVEEDCLALPGGRGQRHAIRILRPADSDAPLPVVLYVPGPALSPGDLPTQRRFERDLALGADAAVVIPEAPQPPGEHYPAAIERLHAVAAWIAAHGAEVGLEPRRMAVVGVSTGANLVAGLTLLAQRHGGPRLLHQVLVCPATDAAADSGSYQEFADDYFLGGSAMREFWSRYVPDPALRASSTASPLRATHDELADLPPALILTAEADVLRDEGEAYAAKLRAAGVAVVSLRYHGTIHGFVAFDALRASHASQAARSQVVDTLHVALHAWRG